MKHYPDPNKLYVLVYDHPAGRDIVKLLPKDTLVKILYIKEGMIYFSPNNSGVIFKTHYGYMFAEATTENLIALEYARKIRNKYLQAKKEMDIAFSHVDTVLGPFEGLGHYEIETIINNQTTPLETK